MEIEDSLETIITKSRGTTAGGVAHAVQTLIERGTDTTTMVESALASADEALLSPHRDAITNLPTVLLKL